jgi:hypothetical protein
MNNENKCLYCITKPIFKSNIELIQHLKLKHCIIDNNNLYSCLYGINGRCSITNDKLPQKEFDEHVIKDHINFSKIEIGKKPAYESFIKAYGLYFRQKSLFIRFIDIFFF